MHGDQLATFDLYVKFEELGADAAYETNFTEQRVVGLLMHIALEFMTAVGKATGRTYAIYYLRLKLYRLWPKE